MSKRPGDPGYAADWCIHYRYNRDVKPGEPDTCGAGVDYETWRGIRHVNKPCFLDEKGRSKPEAMKCPKLRRPTPEEISLHKIWLDERRNLLGKVMVGIAPWRVKHKGQSATEIVECPGCKGKLHLSISSYNGHVHGHCETPNCVSWME